MDLIQAARTASQDATDSGAPPHLAYILDAVPHVTWSATPDGRLDYVSGQWEEDYGGDTQQLIRDGWLALVHPDDRHVASSKWKRAKARVEPYSAEFRVRLPDETYIWVAIRSKPETDASGTIVRWIGTCTDVTDRIIAREALSESERLYRSVLEASADCIKVLDREGRLELMNGPGLRTMELENFDPICGVDWPSLWPVEMGPAVTAAITAASRGEVARFSGSCPTARGTSKWWDVVVTPMRNEEGDVCRLLAISRDMTADRQKSEELRWTSEHDALTSLPNPFRPAFMPPPSELWPLAES